MGELHQPNVARFPSNSTRKKTLEGKSVLIGGVRWRRADTATEEITARFRPTSIAEQKRIEVIVFLRELLRRNLGCDVLAYGSVPLKTFLPDGDIDLTVTGAIKDDLVNQIASLLETQVKRSSGKFVVKDVQLINAEVKLVKCIVENFVVDISINQIGGFCALCFLEHIDRVIGKNHLFKESIILIKAWCYYESRTLGAHAGLISTYALEILVLYIINAFHRTLNGPLSVLYKFLEYFSTFDWDNYCISLTGPVKISALPKIITERPPNSHDLLLGIDFLKCCFEAFSVPMRPGRNGFSLKHLNIIDPLKDDNNVGRSINKANSIRIRSAFAYGARNLRRILMASEDNIADELRRFFSNTMTLHNLRTGSGAEKAFNDVDNGEVFCYIGCRLLKISEEASAKECTSGRLDLTGDFKGHLARLKYTRQWYTNAFATPEIPPLPLPPFTTTNAMGYARNAFYNDGMNALHSGFHLPNQMLMSRPPFGLEPPILTATMPYLPEMARLMDGMSNPTVMPPQGSRFPVDRRGGAPRRTHNPNANGFIHSRELVPRRSPMPFRGPSLHRNRPHNHNRDLPAERMHRPRPASQHRFKAQSAYHLKDEVDFPPLPAVI